MTTDTQNLIVGCANECIRLMTMERVFVKAGQLLDAAEAADMAEANAWFAFNAVAHRA